MTFWVIVVLNNSDFELQIVMVQWVPVKKKTKLKKLGLLCNQTVNLETDAKTLYYNLLKLRYSPSI